MKHTSLRFDGARVPALAAGKQATAGHAWSAPEFFGLAPLSAVMLFALNNNVLKPAYPGLLTGKLSDVCFCFFMPLFLSALLARAGLRGGATRVAFGALVTIIAFVAVKTSPAASAVLDRVVAALTRPLGMSLAPNRVDSTDLVAVPAVGIAWWYARRRARMPDRARRGGAA